MVQRTTKFTVICISIYLVYAFFVFFGLPLLLPDPISLSRSMVSRQTEHLGNLTNYTLETGGQPLRSLLVTFRGSGAISLLYQLSRQPGCYHHFSPLLSYGGRISKKEEIEGALDKLVSLYNCDYNSSLSMLNSGLQTPTFRNFYGVQWRTCLTYTSEVCWDPETLSQICRMYPFINTSVYNLGLKYLAALLARVDLNIRVLLLVRDPRATMTTRTNRTWCVNNPECAQPDELCTGMVDDYEIAQQLIKDYPQRFGIVRYEELAINPTKGLKTIFNFYKMPLKLDELKDKSNPTMYFDRPMEWLHFLDAHEIIKIQKTCEKAMQLWGYRPILKFDDKQVDKFEPLEELPLFLQ